MTAAWAPAVLESAVAPVVEIPTRLVTLAAAAVAVPAGAASADGGDRSETDEKARRGSSEENGATHESPFGGRGRGGSLPAHSPRLPGAAALKLAQSAKKGQTAR